MAFWNRKKNQTPEQSREQVNVQPQEQPAFSNNMGWEMTDNENESTVAPGESIQNGWGMMPAESEETVVENNAPAAPMNSWGMMPAESEETVVENNAPAASMNGWGMVPAESEETVVENNAPAAPMDGWGMMPAESEETVVENNAPAAPVNGWGMMPAESEETVVENNAPAASMDGWGVMPAESEETVVENNAPAAPMDGWGMMPAESEETTTPDAPKPAEAWNFYDFGGDGEETIQSGVVERRLRELNQMNNAFDDDEDPLEKTSAAVMPMPEAFAAMNVPPEMSAAETPAMDGWSYGDDDLDKTTMTGNKPAVEMSGWGDDEGDLDKTVQSKPVMQPAPVVDETVVVETAEPVAEAKPVAVELPDLSGFATAEQIAALESRVNGLAADLVEVSGIAASAVNQSVDYVDVDRFNALENKVNDLAAIVENMKTMMEERMARLEESLVAMAQTQADLTAKVELCPTTEDVTASAAAVAAEALAGVEEKLQARLAENADTLKAQLTESTDSLKTELDEAMTRNAASANEALNIRMDEAVNEMNLQLTGHGGRIAAVEMAVAKQKVAADADRKQIRDLVIKLEHTQSESAVLKQQLADAPLRVAPAAEAPRPQLSYPVYPARWADPDTLLELWQNGSALMGLSRFLQANSTDAAAAAQSLYMAMPAAARQEMLKCLTWDGVLAYNETNTPDEERPADTFMALDFGGGELDTKYMDTPAEVNMDWVNGKAYRLSILGLADGEAVPDICPEEGVWSQTAAELQNPAGMIPGRYAVIMAESK